MYLPYVDSDVGFSVARSFNDFEDKRLVARKLKSIEEENPAIAEIITKWSKEGSESEEYWQEIDEEQYCHIALCGIMVYEMLRSQAEANYMQDQISLE